MKLIDIHTHHPKSGIHYQIVNQSIDNTTGFDHPLSLALHPWKVDEDYKEQLLKIQQRISSPEIIAIGEAGLDKINGGEWRLQLLAFEEQVKMANNIKMPLIIHCVKAYSELLQYFNRYQPSSAWIIHNFTGGATLAKQFTDKGIYLSFGASLMRGHQKTIEALRSIPDNLLFLETDDDPLIDIEGVYTKAATIKNMSCENLNDLIHHNFTKCFNKSI